MLPVRVFQLCRATCLSRARPKADLLLQSPVNYSSYPFIFLLQLPFFTLIKPREPKLHRQAAQPALQWLVMGQKLL